MIVELKSLIPALEESFEEGAEQFSKVLTAEQSAAEKPLTEIPELLARLQKEETFSGENTISPSKEHTVPLLLEQLLRSSERNASSSEKIADLLENRENPCGLCPVELLQKKENHSCLLQGREGHPDVLLEATKIRWNGTQAVLVSGREIPSVSEEAL